VNSSCSSWWLLLATDNHGGGVTRNEFPTDQGALGPLPQCQADERELPERTCTWMISSPKSTGQSEILNRETVPESPQRGLNVTKSLVVDLSSTNETPKNNSRLLLKNSRFYSQFSSWVHESGPIPWFIPWPNGRRKCQSSPDSALILRIKRFQPRIWLG